MSDVTTLTPPTPQYTHETPPKHPSMTITNFNYEGSYLPAVICNIVIKADIGRWIPPGNRAEMPWIPVHQNWQMNLLWPMDPQGIENRCLEYCYTKLGRWTYFGKWAPLPGESRIDALNTTTSNLADEQHCTVMSELTPLTPQHPKTPPHDNYKFQLWGLIFARCNM